MSIKCSAYEKQGYCGCSRRPAISLRCARGVFVFCGPFDGVNGVSNVKIACNGGGKLLQ